MFTRKKLNKKDPWVAAYALNLCTVSVTQIIEYNDLRFMEQEYENILNNLNLEMIPKDDALLDVLKQILDVINFFKIQSHEKELLDKEYQQKLKDAVWSAVPSPSVILAGGKAGLVGLAVSAATAVGTGYMNYRKEKAKINNEQERKNWELERSAMEQLHGLQRQLFETAWRLADEYEFPDEYRLTERQIKQYNDILNDKDDQRRYERLWLIKDNYVAYPPFWYYTGSAALHFAKQNEEDADICRKYLFYALHCYNEFFNKSKIQQKLLREDPIVAQCTFEYLSTLNMIELKKFVPDDTQFKKCLDTRLEKLDNALSSVGSSYDIWQQCALNYLSLSEDDKAIKLMSALINEQYNVSTNAQFLSLLYVKKLLAGDKTARVEYSLLENKVPANVIMYPLIFNESEKKDADKKFLIKLKINATEKYRQAINAFANETRKDFLEIVDKSYDITDEVIEFFDRLANSIYGLSSKSSYNVVREKIEDFAKEKNIKLAMEDLAERKKIDFDSLLKNIFGGLTYAVLSDVIRAETMETISLTESNIISFCEKQKITLRMNAAEKEAKSRLKSIESSLLGKNYDDYLEKKEIINAYTKSLSLETGCSVIKNEKKAKFITINDGICFNEYKNEISIPLKKYNMEAFATIRYTNRNKQDIIFTTKGIYILNSRNCEVLKYSKYHEISCLDTGKSLERKNKEELYSRSAVDYDQLRLIISQLVEVEEKFAKTIKSNERININHIIEPMFNEWKRSLEML